jgi:aromatic-L-amino-acid/L-tryptophan decarboxylase
METQDFRKQAHEFVDWMADFFDNVDQYPVTPQIKPGDIKKQLPLSAPETSEPMDKIFDDFKKIIVPGMTHWQNPNFFGYFPANNSKPSVLAEMLTATMGAQCMIWLTSPAAAELEEVVMEWLRKMTGLPDTFKGVIQDTASTSTLCAILTAREKKSNFNINNKGFNGNENFVVYCSDHAHSSVDKAVKIAGIGIQNLVKIDVDDAFAMKPMALEEQIKKDLAANRVPLCVISAMGTTSSTAVDPVEAIGKICQEYNVWHHVDGAFAGSALVLPEMRWMAKGMETADSFVFNPHKWMFTNFDCSAYFVKDPATLINTFTITPEYLKTTADNEVNNYRDWGIQLGRRFRALKLWFVIRSYGLEGIQQKFRLHLRLAQWVKTQIETSTDFELLAPVNLNTVCFRYLPKGIGDQKEIDSFNEKLLSRVNQTGKIFITHTKLNGKYTIRMSIGQTETTEQHVKEAWKLITETVKALG